jgi:hypothetical protein
MHQRGGMGSAGGRMGKGVLVVVGVVLVGLVYLGYRSYDAPRADTSGTVRTRDTAIERVDNAASRPDSSESETVVYPKAATTPQAASTETTAQENVATAAQTTASAQPAPASAPASDTISPNPPNGMVFSGTGRYQLYRQGNITWRLDTDTGRTCIIFATNEEWHKPQVYHAGCGSH